jgi:hypothetical protein
MTITRGAIIRGIIMGRGRGIIGRGRELMIADVRLMIGERRIDARRQSIVTTLAL